VALLAVLGAGGALALRAKLRASLPATSGERGLAGLAAPVRVERDARGIPTLRGASRLDLARATGFVHAQERFFQMDLLRRRAAGELAELIGPGVLKLDREVRLYRFRAVARRMLAAASEEDRALVGAYVEGVNAGLAALGAPPFEYLLLRSRPAPWRGEDTVLSSLAMFLTLQGKEIRDEVSLGLMHDLLPPEIFDFLAPRGTEWDAPVVGEPYAQPPVPSAAVFDLRSAGPRAADAIAPPSEAEEPAGLGSNNWAVAGRLTAHGGAILANDMHLGIAVPNTWYYASLVWPGAEGPERVTGVTLPGTPFVVVGSNTRVAWGFTNSQGDWSDIVVVEPDPGHPDVYLTPEGPRPLGRSPETLHVKGGEDQRLEVVSTIWGPVVGRDVRGRPLAAHWVPLVPEGVNMGLARLETARSLDEALGLAARAGIPHQNFVCADATGRIGWTIAGRIPRRVGFDGRLPTSWADGMRRWDGWLDPAEYPRIVDPPEGRIWTANARVVDGEMLGKIGFGGYDLGARARQVRDDLRAFPRATERDMLAAQLDDRALFLARWRELLLRTLTPEAVERSRLRAQMRQYVESWGGHAATSSVGYRLVRAFRASVSDLVFGPILASCRKADEGFDFGRIRQSEGPLWALVSVRPAHLLNPAYRSWDELLLAAADRTLDTLLAKGGRLDARTWGERNTVRIQHPLSRAIPALGFFLDMPRQPLPGDSNMPRFQSPDAGASERLVVSPGREGEGFYHMPDGESGHPLSPHYRDGHEAWVSGEPLPFLPGPAVDVLTLVPAPGGAPGR
jgi:penicillin amidase